MNGLVDYDISDSDEDNEESPEVIVLKNERKVPEIPAIPPPKPSTSSSSSSLPSSQPSSSSSTNSSVLKNLPEASKSSSSLLTKSDFIKRTANGRIQIKAPALNIKANDYESDEEDSEDEAERARKRLKASDKGSGLFSMLPQPKRAPTKAVISNGSATTAKASTKLPAFVPKSVSDRRKAPVPKPPKLSDDEDDDDEPESFFFTKHRPVPETAPQTVGDHLDDDDVIYGPARPEVSFQDQEEGPSTSGVQNPNDDFAYKRMIASKFGEDVQENMQIMDFNMDDHLRNNKEWIKNISKESEIVDDKHAGPAPGGNAKRKNQITYLAYQAKKREVELKNQWAANRATQQQARSRYGF